MSDGCERKPPVFCGTIILLLRRTLNVCDSCKHTSILVMFHFYIEFAYNFAVQRSFVTSL